MTLVIPASKGQSTYLTLVDLSLSNTWIPNISHWMQQLHVEEEILELKIVL